MTALSNWFSGKGSQNKMFNEFKKHQDAIFVARDVSSALGARSRDVKKGTKEYNAISTGNYKHLEAEIEHNPNLYEMTFIKDRATSLGVDIDGEDLKMSNSERPLRSLEIVNEFKQSFSSFFKKQFPAVVCIRYFTSETIYPDRPNKTSIHIIIRATDKNKNEYFFKTPTDAKRLFENYQQEYPAIKIDLSIYSKNRCFRLLGCSKLCYSVKSTMMEDNEFTLEELSDTFKLFCASYVPQNRIALQIDDEKAVIKKSAKEKASKEKATKDDEKPTNAVKKVKKIFKRAVERVDNIPIERDDVLKLLLEHPFSNRILVKYELAPNYTKSKRAIVYNLEQRTVGKVWCDVCNQFETDRIHGDVDKFGRNKFIVITKSSLFMSCFRNTDYRIELYTTRDKFIQLPKTIKIDPSLTTLDNEVEIYETPEGWCKPIGDYPKIELIKSHLGKGKTLSCINYIKSLHEQVDRLNILYISPRRSYAWNITNELNEKLPRTKHFTCYLEEKKNLREIKKLVVQVESLHRIAGKIFDVVILDECESILFQATSISTQRDIISVNNNVLLDIFKNTRRKILCADAFISNKTLNFLNDMKLSYKLSINTSKPVPRQAIRIYNDNPEFKEKERRELEKTELLNILLRKLCANERVFFVSSSKKFTEEEIVPLINKCIELGVLTADNWKIYSSCRGCITEDCNVRKTWAKLKLIVCTTTITVGVNFDIPKVFDCILMYVSSSSGVCIRDLFQAHMRVRSLKSDMMFYVLDDRAIGKSRIYEKDEIAKGLSSKCAIFEEDKFCSEYFLKSEDVMKNLYVDNIHENSISVLFTKQIFDLYLKECNYTQSNLVVGETKQDIEIEKIDLEKEYDTILEIDDIEFKTLDEKKTKIGLSLDERNQYYKYIFRTKILDPSVPVEDISGIWKRYFYEFNGRRKVMFAQYERGLRENTITLDDIKCIYGNRKMKDDDNFVNNIEYTMYSDMIPFQIEMAGELCSIFGLSHLSQDKIIPKKLLEDNADRIAGIISKYETVFNLRAIPERKVKDKLKTLQGNVKRIFEAVGCSELKNDEVKHLSEDRKRYHDLHNVAEFDFHAHFVAKRTKAVINETDLNLLHG
jgi:hypothetical protein